MLQTRSARARLIARGPTVAWLLAALLVSLTLSAYFLPLFMDDALISYRYSERLLQGHGLTWNDGEFVEGYSNLLWVLLVAAVGLLQPDLILVGWILGLVANAAALGGLAWAFSASRTGSAMPLIGGLAALALSLSFAFWGVGGLETALLGALLSWALATLQRPLNGAWSWACPSLLLGLVAITRPDGILFAVTIAGTRYALASFRRPALTDGARLVMLPFAFVAAQVAFRLTYYGDALPNTAHAKLAFATDRVLLGTEYVARAALLNCIPLGILFGGVVWLGLSRQWRTLRQAAMFLGPAGMWLAYVAIIGGDAFPFQRHWIPAWVCCAFALSVVLSAMPPLRFGHLVLVTATAAALYFTVQWMLNPWQVEYGQTRVQARILADVAKGTRVTKPARLASTPLQQVQNTYSTCLALGQFLRDAFTAQQPMIAVNVAGCLPYLSRFPALDMLGLNDAHIVRQRPADMGEGAIGHELGDGAYVLGRKPDLIVFCGLDGTFANVVVPCFRSERELSGMPEFAELYRLVYFRTGTTEAAMWTRIEGGRLGIVRRPDRVRIPGFLLATTQGARAMLDTSGRLVATLERGSAEITDVYLPAGVWEISLQTNRSNPLQLTTSPPTENWRVNRWTIRLLSHGAAHTFRVFGGKGTIEAVVAERVTAAPATPPTRE